MAGIYIHIPFCGSKCGYCDFYSMACGVDLHHRSMRVVTAILEEARIRISELADPVETIYIGGGTPSLLPPDVLSELLDGIAGTIDLSNVREWTFEANPEDVTHGLLSRLRSAGVNRISIGIQSFDDSVLRFIGRRHDSARAIEVLNLLADGGWNYSGDLIFGLPRQSPAIFRKDVETLLSFSLPHFSAYLLSIEPSTRFGRLLDAGIITEASDSEVMEMYECLTSSARMKGYEHYEISNYALPGFRSHHNSSYWDSVPYLGLGPAAYSFDGSNRLYNPLSVDDYLMAVESGEKAVIIEEETVLDRFNDYIFTSLRTISGFDPLRAGTIDQGMAQRAIDSMRTDKRLIAREDGSFSIPEQSFMVSDAIIRDHLL